MVKGKGSRLTIALTVTILAVGVIAVYEARDSITNIFSPNDPQQVAKAWLQYYASALNGLNVDYQKIYDLSVNEDGNQLSESCKGNYSKGFDLEKEILNVSVSFQTGTPFPCTQSDDVKGEYADLNKP